MKALGKGCTSHKNPYNLTIVTGKGSNNFKLAARKRLRKRLVMPLCRFFRSDLEDYSRKEGSAVVLPLTLVISTLPPSSLRGRDSTIFPGNTVSLSRDSFYRQPWISPVKCECQSLPTIPLETCETNDLRLFFFAYTSRCITQCDAI